MEKFLLCNILQELKESKIFCALRSRRIIKITVSATDYHTFLKILPFLF